MLLKDNANAFGELNSNAKLFVVELIGEPLGWVSI